MPAWMTWIVRFGIEVFRSVSPALSWPGIAVKGVGLLAASIATLTLTNRVSLAITPADGSPMSESAQIELRWVAYFLAAIAVLIWAAGAAWVRVFTLRVQEGVTRNGSEYQLTISNLGFSETPVLVRVEEVADESGPRADWNVLFPIVLFNSPISRGFPHAIVLFTHRAILDESDPRALLDVTDVVRPDKAAYSLGPVSFSKRNKIWFRVAISQVNRSMWFSVQMVERDWKATLRVVCELPPHLST